MIPKYENKMLQVNKQTKGLPPGSKVLIKTDKKGIPLDQTWRKKLKDAETDNCVSFVAKPKSTKAKESKNDYRNT